MQAERVIVSTKAALGHAVDQGVAEIEVHGRLADRLRKAEALRTASKWRLGVLAASIPALPSTGGASSLVVAPLAFATGLSGGTIAAIMILGLGLIYAIHKNYTVGSETVRTPDGTVRNFTVLCPKKREGRAAHLR